MTVPCVTLKNFMHTSVTIKHEFSMIQSLYDAGAILPFTCQILPAFIPFCVHRTLLDHTLRIIPDACLIPPALIPFFDKRTLLEHALRIIPDACWILPALFPFFDKRTLLEHALLLIPDAVCIGGARVLEFDDGAGVPGLLHWRERVR